MEPIFDTMLRKVLMHCHPKSTTVLPICFSDELGMYHALDDTYTELSTTENVRNCRGIGMWIRSASDVTGNIELVVKFKEIPLATAIIPVSTRDKKHKIMFSAVTGGLLTIERNCNSEFDTLKDVEIVTAIVGTDIELY